VTDTFRLAGPGDVPAITALVRAAYGKWVPLIGREPMPMRTDYAQAIGQHRFDLVVEGDRLVGLIETEPRDGHLWIENVCVLPEVQGRGIGRRLLAHAEIMAKNSGLPQTRLLTNAAFADNIALYKRVGYVVDREEPFMNGITVYMSKALG
jgi:GNAT superfamily N-acetyltransferase